MVVSRIRCKGIDDSNAQSFYFVRFESILQVMPYLADCQRDFFSSNKIFFSVIDSVNGAVKKKVGKKEENPLAVSEIFCNFAFRITNALYMAKKRSIDEYMIRTLSYYQSQGGIYSEIITLLMQLREKKGYRNLIPLPAKVLNAASYYYDETKDGNYDLACGTPNILVESVVTIMAAADNNKEVKKKMLEVVKNDEKFFPHFTKLLEKLEKQDDNTDFKAEIESLRAESEKLQSQSKAKDSVIDDLLDSLALASQDMDTMAAKLAAAEKRCQIAEQNKYEGSSLDRYFTLDNILKWIEGRKQYIYVDQVFRMLSDIKDGIATKEESMRIKRLEEDMLAKELPRNIINNNYAYGSNQMTGMLNNPQLPIGVTLEDFQKKIENWIKNMNHEQQQG